MKTPTVPSGIGEDLFEPDATLPKFRPGGLLVVHCGGNADDADSVNQGQNEGKEQRVLSLSFALRYRLAFDATLLRDVLDVFVRRSFASLRRRARKQWAIARGHCGAVTFASATR